MYNPSQLGFNPAPPQTFAPSQYNALQRLIARIAGINLSPAVAPVDAPAVTTSKTDVPGVPSADPPSILGDMVRWDNLLSLEARDRISRYREYDSMDSGDVASQLDAIVDAVLISDDAREEAFKLEVRKNKKIDNLCQELIERIGLQLKIESYMRAILKYGDMPIALWLDDNQNVVATQGIHPEYMRRRTDTFGRLLAGEESVVVNSQKTQLPRAYWQVSFIGAGIGAPEQPINAWYPWNMIWAMWRKSDFYRYSFGSYIEDMRRDWVKLRYMEASVVVARGTRAYPRRIFYLDTTGQNPTDKAKSLKEFKETLGLSELHNVDGSGNIIAGTQVRNPLDVDSDIFVATAYRTGPDGKLYPQLNDTKFEDPRLAGIEHLGDLEYMRGKMYRRVSPELMGVERGGRDVTLQDLASARMFQRCANILKYQIILPLCNLQCLLKGYTLDDKDVDVMFSNYTVKNSWRHSDAAFRQSMADMNALAMGVTTVKQLMQENDKITDSMWNAHIEQMRAEQKLRDDGVLPVVGQTNTGMNGEGTGTKTGNNQPPNQSQVRKGSNSS